MSFEESKQCLLEATNHGMTQVVTDILDRYPNAIDAIDEVKRTSLIIASSKGDVDTVAVLLARNASIDNKDNNGYTALLVAGLEEFSNITNSGLDNISGSNCTFEDDCGKEIVHLFAESVEKVKADGKRSKILKLLLEYGADPDILSDDIQITALTLSAGLGFDDDVKALLKYNATVNLVEGQTKTPLHIAVGSLRMAYNKSGVEEYKAGIEQAIVTLLEKGASPSISYAGEKSVLDFSKEHNISRFFEIIAEQKLIQLAKLGQVEKARELIDSGVRIEVKNMDGRTPLIQAAYYGHTNLVKTLLKKNANINAQDYDGCSALMLAGLEDFVNMTNHFTSGSNCTFEDDCGKEIVLKYTAESVAKVKADGKRSKILKLLLESGADPDILSGNLTAVALTALAFSAGFGFVDDAKELLKYNATVNLIEGQKWSPLHIAVLNLMIAYNESNSNLT